MKYLLVFSMALLLAGCSLGTGQDDSISSYDQIRSFPLINPSYAVIALTTSGTFANDAVTSGLWSEIDQNGYVQVSDSSNRVMLSAWLQASGQPALRFTQIAYLSFFTGSSGGHNYRGIVGQELKGAQLQITGQYAYDRNLVYTTDIRYDYIVMVVE